MRKNMKVVVFVLSCFFVGLVAHEASGAIKFKRLDARWKAGKAMIRIKMLRTDLAVQGFPGAIVLEGAPRTPRGFSICRTRLG